MRREYLCHIAAAFVGLGVITPPTVILLDRRPVLKIEGVRIEPRISRPGDRVTLYWTATEYRNCAGEVRRMVVNNESKVIHQFEETATTYHAGMVSTPQHFSTSFFIPIGIAIGPATYRSYVTRWCNVFQQYLWPIREDPVEVPIEIAL